MTLCNGNVQDAIRAEVDIDICQVDVLGLVLRGRGGIERIDLHEHLFVRLLHSWSVKDTRQRERDATHLFPVLVE